MRIGPIAFLLLVVSGWSLARVVALWPEKFVPQPRSIVWARALARTPATLGSSPPTLLGSSKVEERVINEQFASRLRAKQTKVRAQEDRLEVASFAAEAPSERPNRAVAVLPATPTRSTPVRRFSLSAWALIRADVSPGLATAGQLGGSQAGVRARFDLGKSVGLAARLSGPIGSSRGKEAAVALDVRPFAALPVTLTVERRIALDRGGRDAFALGMFGGVDREVAPGLRVDGYGQAGVVGIRSRDLYLDGAVRVERDLHSSARWRLGAGMGAWGGAQPGASRLDVGPQLVLHAPVGTLNVRASAEWRQRVAGDARPGSGPVVSLGADF